jgi:hypothetical protein
MLEALGKKGGCVHINYYNAYLDEHYRVKSADADDRIEAVADWLAYEALPWPDFRFPMIPEGNDADTMDFIFLTASINFAFTDFEKHVIFTTDYAGAERSDSDAMMACLKRAYDEGTPILEGRYLA